MSLKYPFLLLLIPIVLFAFWLARKFPQHYRKLYFPIRHRNFQPSQVASMAFLIPLMIRVTAFAFLILCLARPISSSSETRRQAEGIDIMITLDVSQSMMIEDMGNDSRLSFAKETVKRFIQGRSDDRIGFSIFSGDGVTLCPPTLDYQTLLESVNLADVNILRDGTAIGDALAISVNRLKDSKAKSRVIILATDGDNNMGSIAPLTAGEIATGYGIKVYAVAMGTDGTVRMPVVDNTFGFTRKSYQLVESTINPSLLMKIASETGGKFFRATDAGSLQRIFKEIDKLEKTKVETKDRVLWEERYQPFLLIAFLLFLLELVLKSTVFRILPD